MPTCRITICDNRGQESQSATIGGKQELAPCLSGRLRPKGAAGASKRHRAGAPNPKDESGTQAPPPAETSVPYERTKAPEPEPSHQHTIAELCSTKDFVEWVTAVADFQALVEPEVHGVLQAAEFGAVWTSQMETLTKLRRSCVTCPKSLCVTKKFRGRLSSRAQLSFQKRDASR